MSKYIVRENNDNSLWNHLVDKSCQGTVFCKTDFIESIHLLHKTYLVFKGEEPVLGCVIMLDGYGKCVPSPYHFVPYQGFLFFDNYTESSYHKCNSNRFEASKILMEYLVEKYQCLLQTHIGDIDCRPFLWHNYNTPEKGVFKLSLGYTPILDLRKYDTIEQYLSSVRSARRQEYNKAKQANIEVLSSTNIDILIELYDKTFSRQGIDVPIQEKELVADIAKKAIEKKYGNMLVALSNGTPVSCVFFLNDNKRGYYLFGASDPEFRNTFASTLLLIESIWNCKKNGLLEVDFVGCNSPKRGDYKLSYNGKLVCSITTNLLQNISQDNTPCK